MTWSSYLDHEAMEGMSQVGHTFSNSFFATMRASVLQQGKALVHPSGKHTQNVKTILISDTKRQLNEVQPLHCGGWKNAKPEKLGLARELGRTTWPSWVSQTLARCLIYDHLSILASLIREQTVASLQGHQDDRRLALRGHFCGSRMNFIHTSHNLYRFCYCLFMKVS